MSVSGYSPTEKGEIKQGKKPFFLSCSGLPYVNEPSHLFFIPASIGALTKMGRRPSVQGFAV